MFLPLPQSVFAFATAVPQQYGSAYLITSISLSIVSFSLCYVAIDAGVDVAALLKNVSHVVPPRRACRASVPLLRCSSLTACPPFSSKRWVSRLAGLASRRAFCPPTCGSQQTPCSADLSTRALREQTSALFTQVGTVALAYAVHKAASPIRFPPTVALTPVRRRRPGGWCCAARRISLLPAAHISHRTDNAAVSRCPDRREGDRQEAGGGGERDKVKCG